MEKTAAAVNISFLAAREGIRSLLIDLDPQGAASYYFRIKPADKLKAKTLLNGHRKIDRNIKGTDFENLDALPSDLSFRKLDLIFNDQKHSKKQLREILHPFRKEYELIIIDAPPNLTLLSESIFDAADQIIVPIIPTTLSVLTLERLLQFFKQKKLKSSKIRGFFSMVESRKNLHRETMVKLRNEYPSLLNAAIPYLSDIEKMGLHRAPVVQFKSKSPAAVAYENLWQEINHIIFH